MSHYRDAVGQVSTFQTMFGPFLGAFFAFLFFLAGEWVRRKIDWRKTVIKEHASLERYFGELQQELFYNRGLLPKIVADYQDHSSNIMNLVLVPIREDSTMKIKDQIFINKLVLYNTELKHLNLSLSNMNNWKDKINIDLLDESQRSRMRGAAVLINFIAQANNFDKVFKYHLNKVDEMMAENRLLLKRYKNWKYDKSKIEKELIKRKELIINEQVAMQKDAKENPIINEHLENLKKFGIAQMDDEDLVKKSSNRK